MLPLSEYDYQPLLKQQPMSLAFMAALQRRALDGDAASEQLIKRHMASLGAYVALRKIEQYGLDQDFVFRQIDAKKLEEAWHQTSFSVFDEDAVHIEAVEEYIDRVIDRTHITTHTGKKIKKEDYSRVIAAMAKWKKEHGAEPAASDLTGELCLPERIAAAAMEEKACRKEETRRFKRLKEAIRDGDLPYSEKFCLLKNLTLHGEGSHTFFYHLYGIIDGVPKSIEQTADILGISADRAKGYYRMMKMGPRRKSLAEIEKHAKLNRKLILFLYTNEKNKKLAEEEAARKDEMMKKKAEAHKRYMNRLKQYINED